MQFDTFFWIVFLVISIVVLIVSWRSIFATRSHGFYRFFAWESIAALLALNLRHWFVAPWSWHQWISWLLLFTSLVPLIFGVAALKKRGKAVSSRSGESELLAFEKTTELVTTGIFRYIRHPLYSSLLLLTWGIFFKLLSWPGLGMAIVSTLFLFFTARADEKECMRYFGASYKEYMQKTKKFIPFLY